MQKRVVIIKPPGIRIIHQAPDKKASSAKDSILPQVMIWAGKPIPIKLRVASATIALRKFITTINMIEEIRPGVKCTHKKGSHTSFLEKEIYLPGIMISVIMI